MENDGPEIVFASQTRQTQEIPQQEDLNPHQPVEARQSPKPQKRCFPCKKHHRKCVRRPHQDKCDRCTLHGYACYHASVESDGKRRTLNRFKCDFCRQSKQKCLPTNRIWPAKCERCSQKNLPCSKPQISSYKKARQASAATSPEPRNLETSDHEEETPQAIPSVSNAGESIAYWNTLPPHSASLRMESLDNKSPVIAPPKRATRTGGVRDPRRLTFFPSAPTSNPFEDFAWSFIPSRNEYNYKPLAENEIRLLSLQPGEGEATIECALVTSSIENATFEALSYAWGSDAPARQIRILCLEGRGSLKNFKRAKVYIRPNLYSALRALRDPTRQVSLWVDALSINQTDDREKSAQVPRIGEIYNRASNVCVWLGESSLNRTIALRFIPQILDLSRFDDLIRDTFALHQWVALIDVLKNRWFCQTWAIPNIAFAREASVHCGREVVHYTDFADAVSLVTNAYDVIQELFRRSQRFDHHPGFFGHVRDLHASFFMEAASNLLRKSEDGSVLETIASLETLVLTLSGFEVNDPRDCVYALVPLAKNSTDSQLPEIDYSKSVIEVFQDFVAFCVRSSGSLDIICRHWAPALKSTEPLRIPSWISPLSESSFGAPNSPFNERINGDSFVGTPRKAFYSAAGTTSASTEFGHKSTFDGSMSVKGFRLDKISSLGPRAADGFLFRESLRMGGWDQDAEGYVKVPDRLWRTLVADRGPEGINPPGWYHRACLYCMTHRTITGNLNTIDLIANPGSPEIMREFLMRVQSVIWNRKFLTTERKQLVGLAPGQAQEGDIICILYGCSVPVLLRERFGPRNVGAAAGGQYSKNLTSRGPLANEPWFELIGECYVHGVMDGEALKDGTDLVERQDEIFTLY